VLCTQNKFHVKWSFYEIMLEMTLVIGVASEPRHVL